MLRERRRLTLSGPASANPPFTSGAACFGSQQKEIRKEPMNDRPDLQSITQIARLYYEERLTQNQIADRLGMSQVSVSRFLRFGRVHPQRHRGHRGTFFGKNGEVRSGDRRFGSERLFVVHGAADATGMEDTEVQGGSDGGWGR